MYHKMLLKKFAFPVSSSGLLAAVVVSGSEKKDDQEKKELVRARNLSIYSKPTPQSNEKESEPKEESVLLTTVRQLRESVWAINDQLGQVSENFNHIIETGKAHTSSSIQILRDEDNYVQRYGAIAAGGLVGYIVAVRRGWFRRLIYTGTGAAAVAAVCYPEQAREYSNDGFKEAKRYIVIAYHFVNGVTRDYIGVQLPNLPGPLANDAKVPTSATLMPPPASGPSHISPVPLPPIELPASVSGDKKKQGNKRLSAKEAKKEKDPEPEPQPATFLHSDPIRPLVNPPFEDDYNNLYTRRG